MKANAQSVSRKLATQFKRSETATTRIRGWHYTTDGFEVTQTRKGVIIGYNINNSFKANPTAAIENRTATLVKIAEFLNAQGLSTEVFTDGVFATEPAN